jgi:hypothetical protein
MRHTMQTSLAAQAVVICRILLLLARTCSAALSLPDTADSKASLCSTSRCSVTTCSRTGNDISMIN